MRHPLVHGVTVALALAAMPTVGAGQQHAEPSASTAPAPGRLPPPVLGREAPWRGGAVPPGYVRHTTGSGLVIGGVVTLLFGYVPLAIGAAAGSDWRLALPVVGPFVIGGESLAGSSRPSCGASLCLSSFDGIGGAFMIATGIAQASAVTMLVFGLADRRQILRYEPARANVRWAMTPGAPGAPLGLTLSLVHL